MALEEMTALLTNHRVLDEVEAVQDAWDELGRVVSLAAEGRCDLSQVRAAEANVAPAERRARAEIRAAVAMIEEAS